MVFLKSGGWIQSFDWLLFVFWRPYPLTQLGCNNGIFTIVAAVLTDGGVAMESNEWTDRFGTVASGMCALHCAMCAFLPVIFSVLGLGFLLSEQTEWLFSIVAILFGVGALILGWRQHGSKKAASFIILGVLGIMASRGMEMSSGHHHDGGDPHHDGAEHAGSATVADAHDAEQHHEKSSGTHDDHKDDHGHDHGDEHGSDHGDEHGGSEESMHLAGAIVGVLSGLTLLLGHLFNIRAARRSREQ